MKGKNTSARTFASIRYPLSEVNSYLQGQVLKEKFESVMKSIYFRLLETGNCLDRAALEKFYKEFDRILIMAERRNEVSRELGLYVILDLHGAPGGQTGSNIDDSVDNVPRLFLDRDNQEKAIALWERIAEHYCGNATVAMYDVLNEPIMPPDAGNGNFDDMIPELMAFYREVIKAIRRKDPAHIISVKGYYWATNFDAFKEKWDDNMVLHFHRYAEPPSIECLTRYLEAGERMDLPVWMGETGEKSGDCRPYSAAGAVCITGGGFR